MHRKLLLAFAGLASLVASGVSRADTLGTATGQLLIRYNGSGPEVPGNISYISTANTVFNFSQSPSLGGTYASHNNFFQAVANQFQFNLVYNLPTNTGSAPSPVLAANGNTHGTVTTVNADWAITDPTFGTIGNSPLRGGNGNGSAVQFTETTTTIPGGFEISLNGTLTTDGLLHFATAAGQNGNGTSSTTTPPWSALLPDGKVYFHGTFDYSTAADTTPGLDVYQSVGNIEFDTTAVPLPATAPVVLGLLGGLALFSKRKYLAGLFGR